MQQSASTDTPVKRDLNMAQARNVIRGKLRSPALGREAPGAAEARKGEGGFRSKAFKPTGGKRSSKEDCSHGS
jgi:hypothetical protein